MKPKRFLLIITSLGALLMASSCSDETDGSNGAANGIHEKVTDVKVLDVHTQTFKNYVEVTGTVQADIESIISAEEAGVIETFARQKGDRVSSGELIVKMKNEVLQANFDEARAASQLSDVTFTRQENLHKDNVISEQKYLEYKYNRDRDRARFENLRARLAKTNITSPIPGIIDERFVNIGEFVQPGTPLLKIVKTDIVKIKAGVPERFVQNIHIDSGVEITIDVLDKTFHGRISFIGPSIDANSRTFPIEIDLKNRDGLLKPHMFANLKIQREEIPDAIVIPRDAVIETEAGKFVFISDGNIASKQEVTIGGSQENQIWIRDGLYPGAQLIIVGHRDLVDGERIQIRE